MSTTPDQSPMLYGNVTVRAPDAPTLVLPTTLTDHQADLIKLVTELVAEKPTNPADALKLLGTLQGKLSEWVLSEVPEKDKVLAGLKLATSVRCFPCFRK